MRVPTDGVSDMAQEFTYYEQPTWWFTKEEIGRGLRERYQVPKEVPPNLQMLVLGVDAVEGNRLLGYSGTRREQIIDTRRVGGIKAFPDWFVLT